MHQDYAVNLLNQCRNPRAHSSFAKPVQERLRDECMYAPPKKGERTLGIVGGIAAGAESV